MTVLGGSLHVVDQHFRELGVVLGGYAPLDVVVEATGARHVHQHRLVLVGVHQRLRNRAAHLAEVHRRAQIGHGVAHVHGEARLVDAHTGLVQRHTHALALGHAATHDRVSAHGLYEVEFHLVALAARQVHRANDGKVGAGLLAQNVVHLALAGGHLADHAVERRIALHGLSKQPGSLYVLGIGRACAHGSLGHDRPPSKGEGCPITGWPRVSKTRGGQATLFISRFCFSGLKPAM